MSIYNKEKQIEILKEIEKWKTPKIPLKERIKFRLQLFLSTRMPLIDKRHVCSYCRKKFMWINAKSMTFHYNIPELNTYEHHEFCRYEHYLLFYDKYIRQKPRSEQTIIDDDVIAEYYDQKR